MKIYLFSTTRNKGHKGYIIEKKVILKNCCVCCNSKKRIELEHIIPVCLGGAIFNKKNLQPMCSICHKKKTNKDRIIISILKKMNIIQDKSRFGGRLLLHPQKVKVLYFELFNNIQNKLTWEDYKNIETVNICENQKPSP